jgi:hypothetical protein
MSPKRAKLLSCLKPALADDELLRNLQAMLENVEYRCRRVTGDKRLGMRGRKRSSDEVAAHCRWRVFWVSLRQPECEERPGT